MSFRTVSMAKGAATARHTYRAQAEQAHPKHKHNHWDSEDTAEHVMEGCSSSAGLLQQVGATAKVIGCVPLPTRPCMHSRERKAICRALAAVKALTAHTDF